MNKALSCQKLIPEWVYGFPIYTNDGVFLCKSAVSMLNIPSMMQMIIPDTLCEKVEGVSDKNGADIYVNDILQTSEYKFVVKYGPCGSGSSKTSCAECYSSGYMGYYLDGYDEHTRNALYQGVRNDLLYWVKESVNIGNIHE